MESGTLFPKMLKLENNAIFRTAVCFRRARLSSKKEKIVNLQAVIARVRGNDVHTHTHSFLVLSLLLNLLTWAPLEFSLLQPWCIAFHLLSASCWSHRCLRTGPGLVWPWHCRIRKRQSYCLWWKRCPVTFTRQCSKSSVSPGFYPGGNWSVILIVCANVLASFLFLRNRL